MTDLTPTEMMNWYLYGQATTPQNLADAALIRPAAATVRVTQDIVSYMSTGAGRFAVGAMFDQVENFFARSALDGDYFYDIPPGIYVQQEGHQLYPQIGPYVGYTGQRHISIQQRSVDDGVGDRADRTFLWNSTAFEIDNSATFVVTPEGERYITNFKIQPYSSVPGRPEDFDFKSGDAIAQYGGLALSYAVDPSGIGRTVIVDFTGQLSSTVYDEDDYLADASYVNSWTTYSPVDPSLVGQMYEIADDLWEDGVIEFLDQGDKPIIYGTLLSDSLSWLLLNNHRYLGEYLDNGVHIIASFGEDILTGSSHDDRLEGGEDDDVIGGFEGNDFVDGGWQGHLDPVNDGTDTAEYIYSPAGVTIDLTAQNPEDLANRLISVANDGYGTQDTLHSIEKLKLSGHADTVTIGENGKAALDYLEEVDAHTQSGGSRDVLDLSQFGSGVKFNGGKIDGYKTIFKNFEKVVLTSENDFAVLSGSTASSLKVLETGNGNDVVYSDVVGLTITFGNGENTLLNAGYGTVVNVGAGQTSIVVSDNVLLKGVKPNDTIVTKAGTVVHGAVGRIGAESKWITGPDGTRYGLNVNGDLVVKDIHGNETYIEKYQGGPGVSFEQQTAGIFVGQQEWHAERLLDLKLSHNDNIAVQFKAGNQLYFIRTGETIFNASYDPLIFDLNGDGINLTPEGAYSPMFDMHNTGFAVHTGWVASDDGILVLDENENGQVDNLGELFGGPGAVGFQALALYDSNSDSVIDLNDAVFADLRIWRDIDGNAVVGDGEFYGLASLGIAAINLTSTPETGVSVGGNAVIATGTFTRADNTTGIIADVEFTTDPFHSVYLGDSTVSAAAALLPNLKGFGTLTDLHVAMTLDPTLIDVVNATMPDLDVVDLTALRQAAMPILIGWASAVPLLDVNGAPITVNPAASHSDIPILVGSDQYGAMVIEDFAYRYTDENENTYWRLASGNDVLDEADNVIAEPTFEDVMAQLQWTVFSAAQIGFIERYLGRPLALDASPADPEALLEAMTPFIEGALAAMNLQAVRLAMHGPLASYFDGVVYDAEANTFSATSDLQLSPMYEAIFAAAPNDATSATNWLAHWKPIIAVVLGDFDRGGVEVTYGYMFASMVRAYEEVGLAISITEAAEALGVPSDLIVADGATLSGTETPDIFYLSGGNQTAVGGLSTDNYVLGGSFGQVVIDDAEAALGRQDPDILRFTTIRSTDVTATRDGTNLVITVTGTGQQVTILEQFIGWKPDLLGGNLNADRGVAQIAFSDGVVWDIPEIAYAVSHPQTTDDTLMGTAAMDVLDGGHGSDALTGGDGGDIYIFGVGYGLDTIEDNQEWILNEAPDYLRFDAGLSRNDVVFRRDGPSDDLDIAISSTDDIVTVVGQFAAGYNILGTMWLDRIEGFVFEDGSYFNWKDVIESLVSNAKTEGDDTIYGFSYEDALDGGSGNDWLSGGNENDIYMFGLGYGADTIKEGADNILGGMTDIVRFAEDLSLTDATFTRVGATDNLLVTFSSGDSLLVDGQFTAFSSGAFGVLWFDRIEQFVFSATEEVITPNEIMDIILTEAKTSGDDYIYGYFREDILDGGVGNDYLAGGVGGDIYRWGLGGGYDVIYDQNSAISLGGNIDAVELSDGLLLTDLAFARGTDIDDLVITITSSGETLTIVDQFLKHATGPIYTEIEELRFSDETVLTASDIRELVIHQSQTSGDDVVRAFHTADTLDGGAGNDTLVGYGGGDTFVFGLGYGQDLVNAYIVYVPRDETDRILFNEDVAPEDIVLLRLGDDLILSISGTDDQLTIADHFSSLGYWKVEEFHFADETVWTAADIQLRMLEGTSGDDVLLGGTDNDYLDGGAGNDILKGRQGDDTYIFGVGYGRDTIDEDNHSLTGDAPDRLLFGAGINLQDLEFVKVGTDDLLVRILGTEDEVTIKDHYFQSAFSISIFELADGTTFTAADVETTITQQGPGIVTHRGTSAADTITGTGHADIIDGLSGADTLRGGWGSDTYLFGVGSGNDVVEEDGLTNEIDTIELVGLDPTDVLVGRNGYDMFITIVSTNEILKVADHFSTQNQGIEQLVFADTTVWDRAAILAQAITVGTEAAETITGTSGADTIDGFGGADTLQGAWGGDTYIYRAGSGDDTIIENGPTGDVDKIKLLGVNPSDVILTRTGDHLFILITATGEKLKVQEHFDGTSWGVEQLIFANGTVWDRAAMQANSITMGTASADTISGTSANETFDGLGGNDTITGGTGSDVYLYRAGSGNDTIIEYNDASSIDQIKLLDLNPSDVTFTRSGNHLFIKINATGEELKVQEQFFSNYGVEQIIFGDSTIWDRSQIQAAAWIRGTSGADSLTGSSAADTIDGQGGNDTMNGGAGGDTYIFGIGSGNDTISENLDAAAVDKVRLVGLAPSDVTFSRTGDHLFITITSSGEQLKVTDHFYSTTYGVEQLVFDDNVVWNRPAILLEVPQVGTIGNDTLSGTARDNSFRGGLGNDTLLGAGGSDYYIYASGDGNDKIDDESGSNVDIDTVWFTDINPGDIALLKSGNDLMVNITATGHQIELDEQFWSATANYGLEQLRFANDTTWNRDTIMQNAWWRGTSGNDTLSGWASFDNIDGGAGNDTINGNNGVDTLVGGDGNDTLTGGGGNDVFVFKTGFGIDTITDFTGGSGVGDVIEFRDGLVADFTTLQAISAQVGSDVIVTVDGSNSITLQNVTLANLNQDDFRFV